MRECQNRSKRIDFSAKPYCLLSEIYEVLVKRDIEKLAHPVRIGKIGGSVRSGLGRSTQEAMGNFTGFYAKSGSVFSAAGKKVNIVLSKFFPNSTRCRCYIH